MRMQSLAKAAFILIGAVMIWLGVKLLLAALTAAALAVGAVLIFAGMMCIFLCGKRR